MRDIPFELKLLGAGSDPAPAPFTGFRQDGMPSDAEIQAALRRARAERANTFVSLIAGVVAWIRKGHQIADPVAQDRKSVVEGKSVSVRVDLGGGRILKKKKQQ